MKGTVKEKVGVGGVVVGAKVGVEWSGVEWR
jgi:hypothetical protein